MSGYEENDSGDSSSIWRGALPWLSLVVAVGCQFSFAQSRIQCSDESARLCQAKDACRILTQQDASRAVVIDQANQAGQLVVPALHGTGRLAASLTADRGSVEFALTLTATAVPLIAGIATWLASTSPTAVALAPWISALLWWLGPNAAQWVDGCLEITLLGPICGFYLASLICHHKRPGLWSWIGLTVSSSLGWLLFPLPWMLFFLPATIAWLVVAHRHEWMWHGWLIFAVLIGTAPFINSWIELSRQWANLGGLIPSLLVSAKPPMIGPRSLLFALGIIQISLMILPCVTRTHHAVGNLCGVAGLAIAGVVGLTRVDQTSVSAVLADVWSLPNPGDDETDEEPTINENPFDGSARLLCDLAGPEHAPLPPVSLIKLRPSVPLLFGSPRNAELLPWSMFNGGFGGRPMFDWSDDELHRLIERWNIGWIWAVHPECIHRIERFPAAKTISTFSNGIVFRLERKHRFILKGSGNWSPQSNGDIVLTEVVPEKGELVLSLRYYRGWTASPGHIMVESEIDPYDSLPIVRLRLDGPVSRIVLHMGN